MDGRREQAEKMLRRSLKERGVTMTDREFREAVDYILTQGDEKGRERG